MKKSLLAVLPFVLGLVACGNRTTISSSSSVSASDSVAEKDSFSSVSSTEKEEDSTSSEETISSESSVTEKPSSCVVLDKKLGCFDSGEADSVETLSTAVSGKIQGVYLAKLGEENVGYIYQLSNTASVPHSTITIQIYFGIYLDGTLGKIDVISDGSTAGRDSMVENGFVKAFNQADRSSRLAMVNTTVSGATLSSRCITEMLQAAIQDQKSR